MKTLQTPPRRRLPGRIIPALVLVLLSAVPGIAGAADEISGSARTSIQALLAEKEARTPAQKKMDSQLVYFAKQRRKEVIAAAAPKLVPDVKADAANRVLVDLNATVSAGLLEAITRGGGTIVNQFTAFNAIRALVPLEIIEILAARGDVRSIAPAALAITNLGSALSQGDRTHRADTARANTGATGSGIKIGVLSDGVNSLAASKANGNLNAAATFLTGQAGSGDEGTAMMEIIQDLVPEAQLIFATAFTSDTSMAANIVALKNAGCSIIVDDVSYFNESPFQDGVISQAVNTVSAAGVLYFSSARNSGNKNDGTSGTWEGDFVSGGAVAAPVTGTGNLLDYGGGTTYNIVGSGGSSRRVDLFWSDPAGGSANDYDLFVLDSTGANVLRSSTNVQTGTQNPYEATGTLNAGERIVIVQRAGAANRFIHLDTGRAVLTIGTAGNVRGHNAAGATNAFSVAATNVANSPSPNFFTGGATNPVETFSSDGPRRLFFDPSGVAYTPGNFSSTGGTVLNKPDITAADGVTTSVPGFTSFFGTSAAAPHAGAIAGLLKSYNPALTPAQIRTAMNGSALDIEAAGNDRDSGAGIVMALGAIQSVAAPSSLITGTPQLAATGLVGGPFNPASTNYTIKNTGAVSLNWTASKTQSWTTLSSSSGTLAPGASATITCSFTSVADGLGLGSYSDTVTLTDTTSGLTRNFSVSLSVVSTLAGAIVTVLPNDNSNSMNARAPITTFNFERSVYLIKAAEMAASGYPTGTVPKTIGWTYLTAPGLAGSAPLNIYFQNTSDTTNLKSTIWTTAISGMTLVHSATTTLPNVTGTFDLTLSGGSPFTYSGGGLYVAFDWGNYTGTLSTSAVVSCNSMGLTNGLLGSQSTSTAPTILSASNFRPETRLSYPAINSPAITNPTSTAVTSNSAMLGGNITSDGGATITERGVVYALTATNANPRLGGAGVTKVTSAGTTGVFTVSASGLTPGSGYSFAAYATNAQLAAYTSPASTFATPGGPTVVLLNRADASPSNAATVNWTLTLSQAVTGVTAGNFSLSGTATAGASIGTPTTADGGVNWNVPVGTGAVDGTLTLSLANSTGQTPAVFTTLPFAGQTCTMDKTTQPPTLLAPATNAVTSNPVSVSFSLPETALAGSVNLILSGAAARTLTLAGSQETSGTHSFSFNPANPAGAPQVSGVSGGSSVPDGVYSMALSYQDQLANAPASVTNTNIRIDTVAPTLNLPAPITVTATSPAGAVVNYSASASDPGGSGVASFSASPVSGSTFPVGVTTVNASATDNAGNAATGGFTVTVNANPPPAGGIFAITPNSGVHQGDPLALTAPGWTDPDTPLTYQFFLGASALNSASLSNSLNVNAPAPGSYTYKVRVTDSAGSFTDTTQPLTVTGSSALQDWRQLYFHTTDNSGDAADTADPDQDGLKNLEEFAFGTDPTDPASGLPALIYTGTLAGGGTVTLPGQPVARFEPPLNPTDTRALFIRRDDYLASGLTYTVEFSGDTTTWAASGVTPVTLADNGTVQVVSVPYPALVGGKPARYFRVRVSIAP